MSDLVHQCKTLGDPTRFAMCKILERGELCVCEFAEELGLAQSTISRHLGQLRDAGLVLARKEGHWLYCRLPGPEADAQTRGLLELVRQAQDPPTL